MRQRVLAPVHKAIPESAVETSTVNRSILAALALHACLHTKRALPHMRKHMPCVPLCREDSCRAAVKGGKRSFPTRCVRARSASDDQPGARAQGDEVDRPTSEARTWAILIANLHRSRRRHGTLTVTSGAMRSIAEPKFRAQTPDRRSVLEFPKENQFKRFSGLQAHRAAREI